MKNFDTKGFGEYIEKYVQEMQQKKLLKGLTKHVIQIPDAKDFLYMSMHYFIEEIEGKKFQWLKEYEEVADWLANNEGKGLLMYGQVGRGKTVLGSKVIPLAFYHFLNKRPLRSYSTDEMNAKIDEIKERVYVSLDDIGTETIVNDYGNKRLAFAEIVDNAEKTEAVLIVTTNLDKKDLIEKYGDRVFDRLIKITKRVLFKGESFRK